MCYKYSLLVCWIIAVISVKSIYASVGDRSPYYRSCLEKCSSANCSEDGTRFQSPSPDHPIYLQFTQWTCQDECRYACMWKTVDAFMGRNWDVPQFHGKWPFIRILGIQEPASVIFSLLNFVAHLIMLRQFRREVRRQSPMFWLWHAYALVCLNAWLWSSIFHSRDTPFTEMMDYFSAFSMVLFSFYSMLIRFLNGRSRILTALITLLCAGFFAHHVTYLALVNFDYGYNMQANIIVGVVNALGWFTWCFWCQKHQPYVWRCALFVLLAGLCMLFEVVDFPPFLWLIDAHALWHLATAGLPFIFYSFKGFYFLLQQRFTDELMTVIYGFLFFLVFLIDDCKYLRKQQEFREDQSKLHYD